MFPLESNVRSWLRPWVSRRAAMKVILFCKRFRSSDDPTHYSHTDLLIWAYLHFKSEICGTALAVQHLNGDINAVPTASYRGSDSTGLSGRKLSNWYYCSYFIDTRTIWRCSHVMEQQEITVCAAITIRGPLVYHIIRWNVKKSDRVNWVYLD